MAKIAVNLSEVTESKPVPNGVYNLTIASVDEMVSQKGLPQLKVSIGIDGQPESPNVTHFVSLPSSKDEPDKAKYKSLFLARFLALFKIPSDESGFDLDDFLGATARAELTLSEPNDNGDVYNRLQVPKMAEGGKKKSTPKPPTTPKR